MNGQDFFFIPRQQKICLVVVLGFALIFLATTVFIESHTAYHPTQLTPSDSLLSAFSHHHHSLIAQQSAHPSATKSFAVGYAPYPVRASKSSVATDSLVADKASLPTYSKIPKLAEGETIAINTTDTTAWKMVPGVGSTFARRIVAYGHRLGGYVSEQQLLEVYGIDKQRFDQIVPYIRLEGAIRQMPINRLEFKELLRHPYLSYDHVKAIFAQKRKSGNITSIEQLAHLAPFTDDDIARLEPYLSFE